MNKKQYNKLFVPRNKDVSYEKIILGYKYNAKDVVLYKDKETYFHVPYFVSPLSLSQSSLLQDGATGGPFPAASDRIFKNRKNYSEHSPYGKTTEVPDGVWFCSWLYKDESNQYKWIDRYYNPGKIDYNAAVKELDKSFLFTPHDPIFRDVPSTVLLEPGVLYKYFHVGENTAEQIVTTFSGISGQKLKLNLTNWEGLTSIDTSSSKAKVFVNNSPSEATTLVTNIIIPTNTAKQAINFDTTENTDIYLLHDDKYSLTNEFTMSFWARSSDWKSSASSQLFGNHSTNGGVGVFINTLSSYPFFVIPETTYGHVLIINEDGKGVLDRSTRTIGSLSSIPELVAVDSDNQIIICNKQTEGVIYKLDIAGKVIASNRNFFIPNAQETPLQILCGKDDDILLVTNKSRYFFDRHLNLKNVQSPVASTNTDKVAYKYNSRLNTFSLETRSNVIDLKYIEEDEWYISSTDNNLYKNGVLFAEFEEGATNFNIDPFDRIWVMYGKGDIKVFRSDVPALSKPVLEFGFPNERVQKVQNVTFFCYYNRNEQSREWRALLTYSENNNFFIVDMSGNLIQKLERFPLFYSNVISILNQTPSLFSFDARGDFTGYEHRRVFYKLAPYNNKPQLLIKATLKDYKQKDLSYCLFKQHTPIELVSDRMQHFALTLKQNQFILYQNSIPKIKMNYSGRYELNYDLQPSFFIGSEGGSRVNFNTENKWTSLIFNGQIADIKIYDYAIPAQNMEMFIREGLFAEDMYWSLPSPSIQYIEKIERIFKNKLPGFKSQFFNVKLTGTGITDIQTKKIIEEEIKEILSEMLPMNTDPVNIIWVS